jgi:hypothetical protein
MAHSKAWHSKARPDSVRIRLRSAAKKILHAPKATTGKNRSFLGH